MKTHRHNTTTPEPWILSQALQLFFWGQPLKLTASPSYSASKFESFPWETFKSPFSNTCNSTTTDPFCMIISDPEFANQILQFSGIKTLLAHLFIKLFRFKVTRFRKSTSLDDVHSKPTQSKTVPTCASNSSHHNTHVWWRSFLSKSAPFRHYIASKNTFILPIKLLFFLI